MKEGGKNKNNKQNKGKKCGFKDNGGSSSNKKPKLAWWKCDKSGHFKKYCPSGNKKNNASVSGSGKGSMQLHGGLILMSQLMFVKIVDGLRHEPVEDGSVLYMGDDHFPHVHGNRSVVLEFSSGKFITLFNVLYVPKLRRLLGFRTLKRKILDEKGIDCIFVGYVEHSKAYRFYVIEPNDSVSINTIIESRDAIFDENRFSSIPRPKYIMPNSDESQRDDHSNDVSSETPKPRKGKRARKAKSYGFDFQLYLVEGSRDQIGSQYSYCYSIEEDPRTYNEAMQSRDVPF
nr:zinc finger, CCHC-type [Tanacetum cinerariifolium]